MEKESTLSVMDKMVKDNNQGIMLSTTITDVKFVKEGAIIGFGVPSEIGKQANTQQIIGCSDYLFMCFAVKISEIEKYRHTTSKKLKIGKRKIVCPKCNEMNGVEIIHEHYECHKCGEEF